MREGEMREEHEPEHASPREALIIAAVVVLVVRTFVPFGDLILYPFTLFATWVHEMGHGLGALCVGGSFDSLEIYSNAAGLAHVSSGEGWPCAVHAAAGLVAPPIVGASILAFARGPQRASMVLWILSAVMLASVPIWVRSVAGWIAIPIVAVLVGALAYKGGPTMKTIGAQFLGVLLGLDTISRIDYLFTGHAMIEGQQRVSDVGIIADAVGLHYLVWGVLLAIVSLACLFVGVRVAWAKPWRLPKWRREPERAAREKKRV